MKLFTDEHTGANFNSDRSHRFALWRTWDAGKPKVAVIGLNPSTAHENRNDPTINKIISIAKNNGYGGLYMLNLFTMVTPHPKQLNSLDKTTLYALNFYIAKCKDVVFAWGNFDTLGRGSEIASEYKNALCLGKNKNGSPKHPLYLRSTTKMEKFW